MSSSTAINGGNPPIAQVGPDIKGVNPTNKKTGDVVGSALKSMNASNPSISLTGRADPNPVGRTWPQFGQLALSYATLGLVRAPVLRAPAPSTEIAPISDTRVEIERPIDESSRMPSNPPPPSTLISRALEAIKSFFTAIYNILFGVRN